MKFECQSTCKGKCCSQWALGDYVFLTKLDRDRLIHALNQNVDQFATKGIFDSTRFAKHRTWQYYLKMPSKSCPFLKNGRCSIYWARPTQCRTYPYWPDLLHKGEATEDSKKSCPGIGKGTKDSRVESLRWLMLQVEADEELARQKI